jgi:hypothetical protein
VNDVKVSLNRNASEPQRMEPPGGELPAHRIDRDERNAQPSHHALFDGFSVIKLHRHLELHARPL